MTELIFSAPDQASLVQCANDLGFLLDGQIVTNGDLVSGGSWFLNLVGDFYYLDIDGNTIKAPGIWGRLRHNGDPSVIPSLPQGSNISLYFYSNTLNEWTLDGTIPAPEWVKNIGVIA